MSKKIAVIGGYNYALDEALQETRIFRTLIVDKDLDVKQAYKEFKIFNKNLPGGTHMPTAFCDYLVKTKIAEELPFDFYPYIFTF